MSDFTKAISTLEFTRIRELLAECAHTAGAKEKAGALLPETDEETVRRLQRETTDAKLLAGRKGTPPFGNLRDPKEAADRACKGAMLTARELLDAAELLHTARSLLDYQGEGRQQEPNSLDIYFSRLMTDRKTEDRITRTILAEDLIADDASPALYDIRRKMRAVNNRIKDKLQSYITGGSYSRYLQDNLVTMRGGRYVIPVRAECKNEVKGLVHDTSSSGATLFIEPMAIVEANNELRELELAEKKEIDRILYELSALIADRTSLLNLDYFNLTELAFAFAKAELSYRMDGGEPEILPEKRILLKKARHPLLPKDKVVPVDVWLGIPADGSRKEKEAGFDTLVITGPNTGGKTVTLKTLGLFVMMAQAGLHLPTADGSACGIFEGVYADIGDEQSIEQSLSTFSAHMKNIVEIERRLDDRSLVLFDELGAGTDPVEGAALAISILERVREKGALCAATTHYAELKAFALETPGVRNASCEFDLATLAPTYRLIIGAPGKSNAFAISEKLGLPTSIVEQARKRVSSEDKRFEQVIEKLEENRVEMEKSRRRQEAEEIESRRRREEAEKELARKLQSAEKDAARAKAEAESLLLSAKVTSEYVLRQLEDAKKKQSAKELDDARRAIRKEIEKTDDLVNPVIRHTNDGYTLPRPLHKGDEVLIVSIGKQGYLESDPDKNGNVSVKAGILSTRTSVKNLRLLTEDTSFTDASGKKQSTAGFGASLAKTFSPELDIRGETGDDGWAMTDKYLDTAMIVRVPKVRIIHGKGTGALRKRLWEEFKRDRRVKSFRYGEFGEGDSGVTVVELRIK